MHITPPEATVDGSPEARRSYRSCEASVSGGSLDRLMDSSVWRAWWRVGVGRWQDTSRHRLVTNTTFRILVGMALALMITVIRRLFWPASMTASVNGNERWAIATIIVGVLVVARIHLAFHLRHCMQTSGFAVTELSDSMRAIISTACSFTSDSAETRSTMHVVQCMTDLKRYLLVYLALVVADSSQDSCCSPTHHTIKELLDSTEASALLAATTHKTVEAPPTGFTSAAHTMQDQRIQFGSPNKLRAAIVELWLRRTVNHGFHRELFTAAQATELNHAVSALSAGYTRVLGGMIADRRGVTSPWHPAWARFLAVYTRAIVLIYLALYAFEREPQHGWWTPMWVMAWGILLFGVDTVAHWVEMPTTLQLIGDDSSHDTDDTESGIGDGEDDQSFNGDGSNEEPEAWLLFLQDELDALLGVHFQGMNAWDQFVQINRCLTRERRNHRRRRHRQPGAIGWSLLWQRLWASRHSLRRSRPSVSPSSPFDFDDSHLSTRRLQLLPTLRSTVATTATASVPSTSTSTITSTINRSHTGVSINSTSASSALRSHAYDERQPLLPFAFTSRLPAVSDVTDEDDDEDDEDDSTGELEAQDHTQIFRTGYMAV